MTVNRPVGVTGKTFKLEHFKTILTQREIKGGKNIEHTNSPRENYYIVVNLYFYSLLFLLYYLHLY